MAKKNPQKDAAKPEKESEATPEDAEKSGKTKLIVISAAAVFLLIAVGAGTYLYFAHPKKPEEPAKPEEAALPVEAKPILVSVDHVVAPLTRNGEVSGYAYLNVNIEVADQATAQAVKDNLPRIRASFAQDLYDRSITDPQNPERADIEAVRARLLGDARTVFGADAVKQVYIVQVQYSRA